MKNTIIGSVVTFGDHSPITIKDTLSEKDWETLQNDCLNVLIKMENHKEEFVVYQNLMRLLYEKDTNKISAFVKKHVASFTSNLFTSVASEFFVQFIKGFLHS